MQGNQKKRQVEQRRKHFMTGGRQGALTNQQGQAVAQNRVPQQTQAGRWSQPAPGQHHAPHPTMRPMASETLPGSFRPIPQAQLMPEQVIRRTGVAEIPMGQGAFVPQNGMPVSAPFTPPQESREVRPQQQVYETPIADITVILYSSGQSANLLAQQIEALRRQSVHAAHVWVHVDGPSGHDERTLARIPSHRTPVHFGRYFRFALARNAPTEWVAVLDEDTIPGRLWLERSLQTLLDAEDPENPSQYGRAVIACAGSQLGADDPANVLVAGPEFPTNEQLVVDYGRQGFVFHTEFARVLDSVPRAGWGTFAFAFAVSMAASSAGIPLVVLDYTRDQDSWPALRQTGLIDDNDDVYQSYQFYRQMGWEPMFLAAQRNPDGSFAQRQEPSGPAWAQQSAPQQSAPAWTQPEEQGPSMQAGIPPAVDQQGNYPPGARVTHQGHGQDGVTIVETVIPKEHSTPMTGMTERVLQPHERTPPPVSQQTERVLAPHERTQLPENMRPENQRLTSTAAPPSQQTERVVGASTPPPYQSTERVLGQNPAEKK